MGLRQPKPSENHENRIYSPGSISLNDQQMEGAFMSRFFSMVCALACFGFISGCGSSSTHTITGVSSLGGSPGVEITIYGTGFDSVSANNIVTFSGGKSVPATSSNATTIVTTVPSGATTGQIMTSTDGGPEITSPTSFTVLPQLTFSPASGAAGTTITITGANFDSTTPSNNVVAFNGIPATVISSSTTQIVMTVPAGATSGMVTINVDYGNFLLTSADSFSLSQ